ncbi:MAG TPA: CopD family protein [Longimicrobiales bacterium]|nr:CopD family protein [Longimicrobiales bacterium]
MQADPLIHWPEPILEFAGFLGLFLSAGAVGFRYSALRRGLGAGDRLAPTERAAHEDAARRAALLGLLGSLIIAVLTAMSLPRQAARAHVGVLGLLTTNLVAGIQAGCLLLSLAGFALAAARIRAGWVLAAVGVIVGTLRSAFTGQWARLVNPIHELAAALWIGTLLVLVVAGISAVLRDEPARERRGAIVADMVNGFSPLALSMGAVVVTFGLTTAWRHLKSLPALWTTPYGWTLILKLCFVAMVFTLGAWNWRRQRPTLGTEDAAVAIRRSARAELIVATIVLVITAVLVSLPVPKAPMP